MGGGRSTDVLPLPAQSRAYMKTNGMETITETELETALLCELRLSALELGVTPEDFARQVIEETRQLVCRTLS